jgi:hypothetical protein
MLSNAVILLQWAIGGSSTEVDVGSVPCRVSTTIIYPPHVFGVMNIIKMSCLVWSLYVVRY